MKKLIFIFALFFTCLFAFSQSATVWHNAPQLAAVTLNGNGATGTITFPIILGEYDASFQLIPALALSGDSLDFSYIVYQSNSASANIWTALNTADTVASATDANGLYQISDFRGVRIRIICTGVSLDTCTVTPYWVYKKHADE